MILIYPVVSMDTLLGHKGSTYNLLGNPPAFEKIRAFSLHLQVTNDTPPCFIAVAQDDDMMPGSLALFNAMKDKDISCEMHIYSKGGHGFLKYPALQDWGRLCITWLQSNNWKK
jgi:acetyl esterase/lipase